ncbi:hypothetical protein [Achromobacter sp. UMC71]|uniref:hypothetical protein n=1 Tax=Achromobacter sp. UMC71 TaxID=1862320 RepID=UPI0015FF4E72|nr:hypothetical protein [Achromobacter sp. UMC71]
MIFVIIRSPNDVGVVYEKMLGLNEKIKEVNGEPVYEYKNLKPGSGLIIVEFSSSSWKFTTKEVNKKFFEDAGALRVKEANTILYCRGREQYDFILPEYNGLKTFQIIMAYPGSKCGQF